MRIFFFYSLALLLTAISNCQATMPELPFQCSPTSEIFSQDPEPARFYHTNNLRRIVGSALTAPGTPILIRGRLLDSKCIPIANATIELWQADKNGHFVHTDKLLHSGEFVGAGTASTDNMGRFQFLSVMPGSVKEKMPHVNIRVRLSELDELETVAYLGSGTSKGAHVRSSGETEVGKAYDIIITMDEHNSYRRY